MICSYCNTYNNDNIMFCQSCGRAVDSSSNNQEKTNASPGSPEKKEQSKIGSKSDVLMGFQPLVASAPKEEKKHPESIPTQAISQNTQTGVQTVYPPNTPPQAYYPPPLPPQNQPNQINPVHYPHQNQQELKQPLFAKLSSNNAQLILSVFGIALLLIGIFIPLLNFKPNINNSIAGFLDIFGVDNVMDYSNTKLSYSFVSMMAGKPPTINTGKPLGGVIKTYMEEELNQLFSQIKKVNPAHQDESELILRKMISTIQTVGIILSLLTLLLVICLVMRLMNPESLFLTIFVSLLGTMLLILLIAGLIYIKSLKLDLGPLGSFLGISKVNLSQLMLISPAVGYFLLVIGSISAVSSAFMKQP